MAVTKTLAEKEDAILKALEVTHNKYGRAAWASFYSSHHSSSSQVLSKSLSSGQTYDVSAITMHTNGNTTNQNGTNNDMAKNNNRATPQILFDNVS
jgi:hypothetical protein